MIAIGLSVFVIRLFSKVEKFLSSFRHNRHTWWWCWCGIDDEYFCHCFDTRCFLIEGLIEKFGSMIGVKDSARCHIDDNWLKRWRVRSCLTCHHRQAYALRWTIPSTSVHWVTSPQRNKKTSIIFKQPSRSIQSYACLFTEFVQNIYKKNSKVVFRFPWNGVKSLEMFPIFCVFNDSTGSVCGSSNSPSECPRHWQPIEVERQNVYLS